jgi:hypothetical protein
MSDVDPVDVVSARFSNAHISGIDHDAHTHLTGVIRVIVVKGGLVRLVG